MGAGDLELPPVIQAGGLSLTEREYGAFVCGHFARSRECREFVAASLRHAREAAGLSEMGLASRLKAPLRYIKQWEDGRRAGRVSEHLVRRFLTGCGLAEDWGGIVQRMAENDAEWKSLREYEKERYRLTGQRPLLSPLPPAHSIEEARSTVSLAIDSLRRFLATDIDAPPEEHDMEFSYVLQAVLLAYRHRKMTGFLAASREVYASEEVAADPYRRPHFARSIKQRHDNAEAEMLASELSGPPRGLGASFGFPAGWDFLRLVSTRAPRLRARCPEAIRYSKLERMQVRISRARPDVVDAPIDDELAKVKDELRKIEQTVHVAFETLHAMGEQRASEYVAAGLKALGLRGSGSLFASVKRDERRAREKSRRTAHRPGATGVAEDRRAR